MTRFDTTAHPVSAQPANPKSVRFETLDSWRGICALLVAMMHFPAAVPNSWRKALRYGERLHPFRSKTGI